MVRYLVLLVATWLLASCANHSLQSISSDPEVQTTWNNAYVIVSKTERGRMNSRKMQGILKDTSGKPIILYFHGCRGLSTVEVVQLNQFADTANAAGYVVVAPDSFARTVRQQGCPDAKINFDSLNQMRVDEINFAVSQTKAALWADPNNIFLFGHSEGGLAVARYRNADVNAIVISGWGCSVRVLDNGNYSTMDRSVMAPPSVPVINVKSAKDEIDTRPGDCGDSILGRPGGSKVITPPSGHWVFDQAVYRQEVIAFFDENRHADSTTK